MALPAMTIVTERLELRPLEPDDADAMAAVLDDERLHDFTGGRPLAPDELRAQYERLARGGPEDGSEQWCNWIVRVAPERQPVGYIQATVTDEGRAAAVAWVIGVPWQGRGYAAEAAIAIVDWLVDAGVDSVEAHIHPDHEASGRVATRAGLEPSADLVDGEVVWRQPPDR
jgi:RimJ/RimL family protein N-acetyltransferase